MLNLPILMTLLISAGTIQSDDEIKRIPDATLNGIAAVNVSIDGQAYISYNPVVCDQVGAQICAFYLLHEEAHIRLRHATRNVPREQGEPEADCWAAKSLPLPWAQMAYEWFRSGRGMPSVYGSQDVRAEKIRECAGF